MNYKLWICIHSALLVVHVTLFCGNLTLGIINNSLPNYGFAFGLNIPFVIIHGLFIKWNNNWMTMKDNIGGKQ